MNKRQKIVQQAFLDNEEAVIKELESTYANALKEIEKKAKELQDQIAALQTAIDTAEGEELETLKSMQQSKVYQKQYQDALRKQIGSVLDNMQVEEFKAVSAYLEKCYETGFIGTMYDMHGQGVPFLFPIDQEAIVRAVQLDSKISVGLYTKLGEDIPELKKKIAAQVSRGIATGENFHQVAQRLSGISKTGYNNAVRIARTEGHRIQVQSSMDACYKAKDKGADIVKQWDAALDNRTRESHAQVDGEIRQLDEKFSNGLMFPGDPSGGAAEVCNCRCALLQRSRLALDAAELEELKRRAEYFGLDKSENFEDFKETYLKSAKESAKMDAEKFVPAKTIKEAEKFARETLGIPCSYKGVDIRCANEMNAAFQRGLRYCPQIRDGMHFVGSGQERNKRLTKELTEYYAKQLKHKYPGQAGSVYAKLSKAIAEKSVGVIDDKTYAFASRCNASSPDVAKKYTGIFVNDVWGKDSAKFTKHLATEVKTGLHPIGCDTIASVFDHEIAHQIDYAKGLRDNPEMLKLFESLTKRDIETGLSQYGATSINEFIAEGYAEYRNADNPREIAKQIGEIIERAVKS